MKKKPKEKETKPKKNIASNVESEECDSLMDRKDTSLLARRFNKFLLISKGKNFIKSKYKENGDNEVICYECKKFGHI